ncbi:hypothetical protein N658DRAFT_246834 [Parathielavia hyrcaniae]|uniref:Uncharacterized protein n=1 Tax=Parathielavia hyrcaniae TaxID=113614 RepID=A0AAN6T4Y5_9PEZI|nr:hypothetical protein N658DRAFT_246834 [Parathielavia hyrcaniae]
MVRGTSRAGPGTQHYSAMRQHQAALFWGDFAICQLLTASATNGPGPSASESRICGDGTELPSEAALHRAMWPGKTDPQRPTGASTPASWRRQQMCHACIVQNVWFGVACCPPLLIYIYRSSRLS